MWKCKEEGVFGGKALTVTQFGASFSLFLGILVLILILRVPEIHTDRTVSTESTRRFCLWTNFCGIAFSSIAVATSMTVVSNPSHHFETVNMGLMLGWVFTATLTIFWTMAFYYHTTHVLNLPRRKGDINILLATSRLMLRDIVNNTTRAAVVIGITFTATVVGFFIFTNISTREDRFPHLFIAFFLVYLLFDLILLVMLVQVTVSTRLLASMPILANRILICVSIGFLSFVWLILVFSKGLSSGSGYAIPKHQACFYFWFNKALLPPVILSVQLNSIAFLTPRSICGMISSCCRCLSRVTLSAADTADSAGDVMDTCALSCLEACPFSSSSPEDNRAMIRLSGSNHSRPNSLLSCDGDAFLMDRLEEFLEAIDIEPLIIPPQFIEVSKAPIAAGGFAQVHSGVFAGKKVAIKKVFTQFSEGKNDEFGHEVRILNLLKGDPHVILLHGVSIQGDRDVFTLLMVLEWCPLSLTDLITNVRKPQRNNSFKAWLSPKTPQLPILGPSLFLEIAKQLMNALLMLHFKGFVHRDLKPDNILFSDPQRPDCSLKLCDFGTARIAEDGRCSHYTDLGGLSPLYSPPEAINVPNLQSTISELIQPPGFEKAEIVVHDKFDENGYDGRKFDMYSTGMILREMWLKDKPSLVRNSDLSAQDIPDASLDMLNKTVAGYRPDLTITGPFGYLSPELMDLTERLWDPIPDRRPTAKEAKEILESDSVRKFIDMKQRTWSGSFHKRMIDDDVVVADSPLFSDHASTSRSSIGISGMGVNIEESLLENE